MNRRTDNTTTKRKKTKGQTKIYKTLHRKLKLEPLYKPGGTQMLLTQNDMLKIL
jgi:hypothetical protein